jgi:arylsulfatase A
VIRNFLGGSKARKARITAVSVEIKNSILDFVCLNSRPIRWTMAVVRLSIITTHLWLSAIQIFASAAIALSAETSRPNIIILFADNLGYADISLFGAPSAQTPNIDRLGIQGIKLNNWNSAAHLCSASRASLLTGKYAVRSGVYPGVFKPDAVNGLLPSEITIAEYLKEEGYATSIVGKWHLGHRPDFLPTNQGFDEWLGVPYHMSGGSLDNHTCAFDRSEEMWLPLYEDQKIIQQPVRLESLSTRYATRAQDFILRNSREQQPFFLYLPFSHVHQLCAPRDQPEQQTCQWNASGVASFTDAVEEMDWITGQVLEALDESGVTNDTLVLFTSDNGPWVAEQSCSGFKGPFEGRW